jgi:DNA polymerase I-like protein with 3'-5' exonuclease and polymerase domains
MGEGVETREDAKKAFFSWLYDEKKKNEKLEQIYKRDDVRKGHFKDGHVTTPFGNTMNADYHHALSYLIQGTTAEMVLRQAIKIDEFLKDHKSFIAFTIHDSVIIDISKDETNLVPKLLGMFADTELGFFKVNASFGDDFGNLREVAK